MYISAKSWCLPIVSVLTTIKIGLGVRQQALKILIFIDRMVRDD